MIAKRIRRDKMRVRGSPQKLGRMIIALVTYVYNADPTLLIQAEGIAARSTYALNLKLAEIGVEVGEKVLNFGGCNFAGGELIDWQAQMISTALQCPRSRNPLEHIVLSWQNGEAPTPDQIEAAVATVVDFLGCKENQIIWASHQNTDNIHVHIVINRVNPKTHRMTELGDGWDLDRLAQARATIELQQGWAPEPKAKFVANEKGEVRQRKDGRLIRNADGLQMRCKGDRGRELDKWRSQADVIAIKKAMLTARSWQAMHETLLWFDAEFRPKGRAGATVAIKDVEHKASKFGSEYTMAELTTRLGAFVPSPGTRIEWLEHKAHKAKLDSLNQTVRDARAAAFRALDRLEADSRASAHRIEVREFQRQVLDEAIRTETAAAKRALSAAYDESLTRISAARIAPSEWSRRKKREIPTIGLPMVLLSTRQEAIEHGPPAGYVATQRGLATEYAQPGNNTAAFVDHRVCIIVYSKSDNDVVAALKLAHAKWDVVEVTGSDAFQRQCLRLAAEIGIPAHRPGEKPSPIRTPEAQASNIPGEPTPQLAPTPPAQNGCAPPRGANDLYVYTTMTNLAQMKALVRASGHDVGMKQAVQFDRDRKAFRIATEILTERETATLANVLRNFMTPAAKHAAQHERTMGTNTDVGARPIIPADSPFATTETTKRPAPGQAPKPGADAQVPRARGLAARAMMARVFQSSDWNPSDYWAGFNHQNGPAGSVPLQSAMPEDRRMTAPPVTARHGQSSATQQATRAASFAAASRSRGPG